MAKVLMESMEVNCGKFEDGELRGRLEAVDLQDPARAGGGVGQGDIHVRLHDVAEIIQAECAGFHAVVRAGKFERGLEAAIHHPAEEGALGLEAW